MLFAGNVANCGEIGLSSTNDEGGLTRQGDKRKSKMSIPVPSGRKDEAYRLFDIMEQSVSDGAHVANCN